MSNKPGIRDTPGPRFWAALAVTTTLSLVSCGGAVTSIALHTRRVSRAVPLAGGSVAPAGHRPAPECRYLPTGTRTSASRTVPVPARRPPVTDRLTATVRTDLGVITLRLDGQAAPCTVNAFLSLAASGFYGGTSCNRLTTDGRWLLQCGDPTGTGDGGPGYRYPDEHLPTGGHPTYPRGTLAMANAAPDANGSQFFVAYRDTDIAPNYPVFGRVTGGMEIIDRVAAAGVAGGALDGRPRRQLRIVSIETSR